MIKLTIETHTLYSGGYTNVPGIIEVTDSKGDVQDRIPIVCDIALDAQGSGWEVVFGTMRTHPANLTIERMKPDEIVETANKNFTSDYWVLRRTSQASKKD